MVNATGVLTELDAPGHFSQVWSKKKFSQAGTIFDKTKLSTGLKKPFPADSWVLWFWGSSYRLQCHLYWRGFCNRVRRKWLKWLKIVFLQLCHQIWLQRACIWARRLLRPLHVPHTYHATREAGHASGKPSPKLTCASGGIASTHLQRFRM